MELLIIRFHFKSLIKTTANNRFCASWADVVTINSGACFSHSSS